ncbi:MAG: class I SAM-dependent methyltransferase [Bacteroidia bacterium]
MKSILKAVLIKLPFVGNEFREYFLLRDNSCFSPGHFYSTIVDVKEIEKREKYIWSRRDSLSIPAIDLHLNDQLNLVNEFYQYYQEMPFTDKKLAQLRFYFDNDYYSYTDASVLYFMMRHCRPKRIIEVGSGFSSAIMLDTNQLFFDNKIQLTFIEPFPERLKMLIRADDYNFVNLFESNVQSVDLNIFKQLEEGDFLFIDSSHVSKTDSDLNYLLFEVLPLLKPGVMIHFHDIFYPFEYPKKWVQEGRNWNEIYFLRAFLMYNPVFKIELFVDYLHAHHSECFAKLPLLYKNTGGCMWIKKNYESV